MGVDRHPSPCKNYECSKLPESQDEDCFPFVLVAPKDVGKNTEPPREEVIRRPRERLVFRELSRESNNDAFPPSPVLQEAFVLRTPPRRSLFRNHEEEDCFVLVAPQGMPAASRANGMKLMPRSRTRFSSSNTWFPPPDQATEDVFLTPRSSPPSGSQ